MEGTHYWVGYAFTFITGMLGGAFIMFVIMDCRNRRKEEEKE